MKKYINKFLACSIIFALVVSSYGINTSGLYIYADAASKPKVVLKLDKASVSIEMGNTVTLKLSKKNVASVKKIAWVSKDKKIATVNSKGIVKGIKKGSTVVNATVKYKAKGASNLKSKKLSCKITVKGKPYVETETPAPTAEPVFSAPILRSHNPAVPPARSWKSQALISLLPVCPAVVPPAVP